MANDTDTIYDVLILGGGPAGLSAGIYASRARMSTLMVEKQSAGGQVIMCEAVENYPGHIGSSSGWELGSAMQQQAERFGMQTHFAEVVSLELNGPEKKLHTAQGEVIRGRTVILCLGASPRRLGVPGEMEFIGRGVSYCAVCDGAFFQDKKLVVVGGGDTAVEDSVFLARYASRVTIVHRRDRFRAQRILQERALANPLIDVRWNSVVRAIVGTDTVERVMLEDVNTGEMTEFQADGVFVLVGLNPNTSMVEGAVELDESGYIVTDENMQTNIPGVFAAGDVRRKLLRQIVTACADGAIAATAAEKYLEDLPLSAPGRIDTLQP